MAPHRPAPEGAVAAGGWCCYLWCMSLGLALQSALISVATTTVITFFFEYAAKPRLEARKDRILARCKQRRELEAKVLVIQLTALFSEPGEFTLSELVKTLTSEIPRVTEEVTEAVRAAEELLILGFRNIHGLHLLGRLRQARRHLGDIASELRRESPEPEVMMGSMQSAHECLVACVLHLRPGSRMTMSMRWRFRNFEQLRWRKVLEELHV
jgi:hypothetical protein